MSSASAIESAERDAILEALAAVERRIDAACEASRRCRDEVSLLPVTKTVPVERIAVAVEAGYRQLGENRVQEAAGKSEALSGRGIEWHLIGHLQRNKVKQALDFVHCVESVDRPALVERLARQLEAREARCEVLIQVNTSGAESQFGVTPGEVPSLAAAIAAESSLDLRGLMTIGRLVEDPEDARDCFRMLRELRDRLQQQLGTSLPVLSMGMSGDLDVAIAEGATRVRVGSAIFGERS
ncbi:MAG: YggS family pyridoxal phosphate-dependent enzyme [Halofilum sp. (in: g-proteobacteria)]|nr:YggS family pyridoxal phosphate-dependent enzyme [Halofilum sp. (in: g-proteobacteria)]